MATEILKGQKVRIFIFNNYPFKSEIYEFESDLIFDYEDLVYEDFVDEPELITNLDELDSLIYNNVFTLFLNEYGSIKDWGENSYNVEIQVIDLNGNIIFQSEGFSNYSKIPGL